MKSSVSLVLAVFLVSFFSGCKKEEIMAPSGEATSIDISSDATSTLSVEPDGRYKLMLRPGPKMAKMLMLPFGTATRPGLMATTIGRRNCL